MARENYYILLDLPVDPPELNQTKVEEAIQAKKLQWSRERNLPGKGNRAKANLELVPEMARFLSDAENRKAEAGEALKIKREKDRKQFAALDDAIGMVSLKGYVKEEELTKLARKFKDIPEKDIRKRIKVEIRKAEKTQTAKQKPLESSLAKQIKVDLDLLGKKSLYDFLDLGQKSSERALLEEARKRDAANKRIAKKTAEVTAVGNLVGHCLNVFGSEDKRAQYHETMKMESLSDLYEAMDIAGFDGAILAVEYDRLLKKALSSGLSTAEANEIIGEYAKKKKWAVERPSNPSVDEMFSCGHCGVVNSSKNKACSDCGEPLEINCPDCGKRVATNHRACTHCGFAIGDLPLARRLLRQGQEALARGDVAAAKRDLGSVLVYWPKQKEAAAALERIKKQEGAITNLARDIQTAMREKRFYLALERLQELARAFPNHKELTHEAAIRKQIQAAESKVGAGKRERNADKALDYYLEALSICEDCRAAAEGVAKSPPEPPGKLTINTRGALLALKWQASSSKKGISYQVVRKNNGQPARHDDGEVLTQTPQCLFDDTGAKPGQHYYYAVYAMRKSIPSRQPALCGPVMRTGEVSELEVAHGDGRLDFSWKSPEGVTDVEVWRKQGATPARAGDGTRITGVRSDGFSDGGLRNGAQYGYLICCTYRAPDGSLSKSCGVSKIVTPVQPPRAIKDLVLKKAGRQLELNWTPPDRGLAQFYQVTGRPKWSAGTQLSVTQLSSLGVAIPVRDKASAVIPLTAQGQVWIVPITLAGDLGVVGKAATFTSIEEVSGLKGVLVGHRMCLDWTWPPGAKTAVVSYSYGAHPQAPQGGDGIHRVITQDDYQRQGGFVLVNPERKTHFFTVFIKAEENGGALYSGGKQCQIAFGDILEVHYDIKVQKNLFGKVKSAALRVYTKTGSCSLPAAVLVKKYGRLPIGRHDGEIICRIPDATTINTEPGLFEIPDKKLRKGAYAKLFFEDGSPGKPVRFMSPTKDKLGLS